MKEGGFTNACICMGTKSLSYRTDWWIMTKLGKDEVIMTLHMRLGFSARSAKRWIQGGAKIGQWRASSPKDFCLRSECNSNKPNASLYSELKCRHCLLFGVISQIWQSCFLINHLLRNLNFFSCFSWYLMVSRSPNISFFSLTACLISKYKNI